MIDQKMILLPVLALKYVFEKNNVDHYKRIRFIRKMGNVVFSFGLMQFKIRVDLVTVSFNFPIKITKKYWDVMKCYFKLTAAFEKTENERFE
jgi:hypothetical protein